MEWVAVCLAGFIVGIVCGIMWEKISKIQEALSRLSTPQPKKTSSVVNPSYEPRKQGAGTAHVINPKSPGQIEYEAEQRANKRNIVERSIGK